jgi:hypothetical protein
MWRVETNWRCIRIAGPQQPAAKRLSSTLNLSVRRQTDRLLFVRWEPSWPGKIPMGITYLVANTAKRQYLDPIGNGKLHGLLWGFDGNALAHLLAGVVDAELLLDSWAGDPLFLVDDEPNPNRLPSLSPKTHDNRSAYEIVTQEYDNITLNVVASVFQRYEAHRDFFFEDAESSDTTFIMLADIAIHLSPPKFVRMFEAHFGKGWPSRYKRAVARHGWHRPMPLIIANRKNPPSTTVQTVE